MERFAASLQRGVRPRQEFLIESDTLTAEVEVRIARPTSGGLINWPVSTKLAVSIVPRLDSVPHPCHGRASGGIRLDVDGQEFTHYRLRYRPTVGYVPAAGSWKRLGERGQSFSIRVRVELLEGETWTGELQVSRVDAPAPPWRLKNSVGFDAATAAIEDSGDGTISFSHTAGGTSDRAVFVGQGCGGAPRTPTTASYGGSSMTALQTAFSNSFSAQRSYQLAIGSSLTGAQTVTCVLSSADARHSACALSMTGVDQTTPIGTPQQATGSSLSVDCSDAATDDLVVDFVYVSGTGNTEGNCNPGADQTERAQVASTDSITFGGVSSQSGASGGVMSWSVNSTEFGGLLSAVAFKPSTGGSQAATGVAAVVTVAAPSGAAAPGDAAAAGVAAVVTVAAPVGVAVGGGAAAGAPAVVTVAAPVGVAVGGGAAAGAPAVVTVAVPTGVAFSLLQEATGAPAVVLVAVAAGAATGGAAAAECPACWRRLPRPRRGGGWR